MSGVFCFDQLMSSAFFIDQLTDKALILVMMSSAFFIDQLMSGVLCFDQLMSGVFFIDQLINIGSCY
jgi:hypothetical protein